MKKLFKMMMCMAVAMMSLASCSDDGDGTPKLASPELVQHEQTSENPITLAFSWTAVENATSYVYELSAGDDGAKAVIASGTTSKTSVEIASGSDVTLAFGTKYTFTVKASSANVESDLVSAEVTTSDAPFKMEITNLSYRGATFNIVPTDKNAYYQAAQTEWSKYAAYESDQAFVEGYDFGYYQAKPPFYVPWYEKMKSSSQQGDYSWTTRILTPGQDYIFYTYGVKFQTDNTDEPVVLTTPLIKIKFTAPQWKATSNTTFDVTSVSQTVTDGKVVSTVKVTPSSDSEKYYVTFVEDDYVTSNYGGSDFSFLMGRMGDLEIMGKVKNYSWGTSSLLHTGEQTITNTAVASAGLGSEANLTPGKKYHVVVIGVSDDGLQTTNIKTLSLTAPAS